MTLQYKIHPSRSLLVLSLTILIAVAVSDVGYAFPSLGANCAQCHTEAGGNLEVTPNPLTLLTGESGTVTFDVSDLPSDLESAALSVTGLDAGGLEATVDSIPPWTARDNNTRFTLSGITDIGPQTIDLTIGPGAAPGDYPISVFLAGLSTTVGQWSTTSAFTISVSAIPEPATVVLLSILIGVAAMAFSMRRRDKFAEQRG